MSKDLWKIKLEVCDGDNRYYPESYVVAEDLKSAWVAAEHELEDYFGDDTRMERDPDSEEPVACEVRGYRQATVDSLMRVEPFTAWDPVTGKSYKCSYLVEEYVFRNIFGNII
jgi:hypothetical protein